MPRHCPADDPLGCQPGPEAQIKARHSTNAAFSIQGINLEAFKKYASRRNGYSQKIDLPRRHRVFPVLAGLAAILMPTMMPSALAAFAAPHSVVVAAHVAAPAELTAGTVKSATICAYQAFCASVPLASIAAMLICLHAPRRAARALSQSLAVTRLRPGPLPAAASTEVGVSLSPAARHRATGREAPAALDSTGGRRHLCPPLLCHSQPTDFAASDGFSLTAANP